MKSGHRCKPNVVRALNECGSLREEGDLRTSEFLVPNAQFPILVVEFCRNLLLDLLIYLRISFSCVYKILVIVD